MSAALRPAPCQSRGFPDRGAGIPCSLGARLLGADRLNLASAIPYVTGGLSLVAFVVAALFYGYRARLRQRTELILAAPKGERVAAIDATADFLRIDTANLTSKQKETIILRQLDVRAKRDQMMFVIAIILAVILGFIAITAMLVPSSGGAGDKKDSSAKSDPPAVPASVPPAVVPPPPPTTITASYVVCVGELADHCPQNSVHLPCGSTVADWAKKECSTYGETKLDDVSGNHCGYYTAQITCQKPLTK